MYTVVSISKQAHCSQINMNHLFPHGLRVGDGGGEKAVPLQAAVEAGPVVVAVAGVGQAPGDQGVELTIGGVAHLTCRAAAHATQAAVLALPVPLVVVRVHPVPGYKITFSFFSVFFSFFFFLSFFLLFFFNRNAS